MWKQYINKFVFIFFIIILILVKSTVKAEEGQVVRIGERDRYETAAKAATINWQNSKNVILVNGEAYADAVSAVILSKKLNAPILLTTENSLNIYSKNAMDALKSEKIYIIGGNGSISENVRSLLKNNYSLVELKGKDRYETNLAVAKEMIKLGSTADNIMLVNGEGFSDALSASIIAAQKEKILILGNNNTYQMKPIIHFAKSNNSNTTVIGTTKLINEDIYKKLNGIERIEGGKDRFETNLKVLNRFKSDLKYDKIFLANASTEEYADVLVGAYLSGKSSNPLILFDKQESANNDKALEYIGENLYNSTQLNVIGGSGVFSNEILSYIVKGISEIVEPTVKSVSANGLNQIIVKFNTEIEKNTAEKIENYQIDGVDLGSRDYNKGVAILQDDKKTVIITLVNPYQQYKQVVFTVKENILDKNLTDNIDEFEQNVTFVSLTTPIIESIKAVGNRNIVIKFSKPIRISKDDLEEIKINENSITNLALNKDKTIFYERAGIWSDKIELQFDYSLQKGKNTLKISKGIFKVRFDDAAGFPINETSVDFFIDSATDKPQILRVEGNTFTGEIQVTYNRSMDSETALTPHNYNINAKELNSKEISFLQGSSNTVVKIKGVNGLLHNGGSEILVVNNVKDVYGNKIEDNSGVDFNILKDITKPKITNFKIINSETLKITFNKYVNNAYATNKSNYTFINNEGVDISNKIDKIITANGLNLDNADTYYIKFLKDYGLTESKYNLNVKNIIDTNANPNFMEECNEVIYGIDDKAPYVVDIVKKYDDVQKVIINFSEAMDKNSIINKENYYFINGEGETKKIPNNIVFSVTKDNKSVIIDFPTNYIIGQGQDDSHVIKIGIVGVKDLSGNILRDTVYCNNINVDYTKGPSIVTNTVKAEYDGENIKVKVLLTSPLEDIYLEDFKFAGQTPDSVYMSGNNLILNYINGIKNNEKLNAIKSAGVNALFEIVNPSSRDTSGKLCMSGMDKVYEMNLTPKIVFNLWKVDSTLGNNSIITRFDENIDDKIAALYEDDFIFTNETTGAKLEVNEVIVKEKSIIYKFKDGSISNEDKINVHVNTSLPKINIRSEKDRSGKYTTYIPSDLDFKLRSISSN